MNMKNFLFVLILGMIFVSCQTSTSFDRQTDYEREYPGMTNGEPSNDRLIAEKLLREDDMSRVFVMVEPPTLINLNEEQISSKEVLKNEDAVKAHFEDNLVYPEYEDGRIRGWVYKEGAVYRVITQPYHSTLILFEPGEEIVETPYLSEISSWRISRGIGMKDGKLRHHLVVKPDKQNLNSSLIVVTDKRVYQMELQSTNDTYMPNVSWIYSQDIASPAAQTNTQKGNLTKEMTEIDASRLSFDYKMRYSAVKKPYWLPTMVYDDGIRTYIVLDSKSLLIEYPVIFRDKADIMNYRVKDNVIIIDSLIEKITLRLKNEDVTIEKKITR